MLPKLKLRLIIKSSTMTPANIPLKSSFPNILRDWMMMITTSLFLITSGI